jgi:hypothetical protein
MNNMERVKWPNIHCPQREQCMKNKYRWLCCKLRKEFIQEQNDKRRSRELMISKGILWNEK